MKTNRNMWMTAIAVMIGGTMLMGAGSAMADRPSNNDRGRGDDHGRASQRDNERGHDHAGFGGRDNDRGHDNDRGRNDDRDRDRGGSGVRVGVTWSSPAPVYTTTYVSTTQVWVPASYVMQTQDVLVEPAHWELQWVAAVTETRYPSYGAPYTVVVMPAHQERVWVGDRYEARAVQVLVPGHWETIPGTPGNPGRMYVPAPVPQPRTTISIGGVFRF